MRGSRSSTGPDEAYAPVSVEFFAAVLLLVREGAPDRTRKEISREAARWRTAWSLVLKCPQVALALLRAHQNQMDSVDEEAWTVLSYAQEASLVEDGENGTLHITREGRAYLRARAL
jgi:hypothetical protein